MGARRERNQRAQQLLVEAAQVQNQRHRGAFSAGGHPASGEVVAQHPAAGVAFVRALVAGHDLGLAGVRQAIAVTVGFSSRACKAETVNGYVLLTLSDQPGAPRVALGGGRWRWSDLLSL